MALRLVCGDVAGFWVYDRWFAILGSRNIMRVNDVHS